MDTRRPHLPTVAAGLALLAGLAVVGWGIVRSTTDFGEDFEREQLEQLARIAAASLDPAAVAALAATTADARDPSFQAIRERLVRIRAADPDARFVYLVALRRGQVVFLADAESPDSADYSAPGSEYTEATAALRDACVDGRPFVEGPYVDRWGTWVTGFAPVVDPQTHRLVALLGIDIGAHRWLTMLDRYRGIGLALAVLFGTIVLVSAAAVLFLRRAARRQTALNRSLEQELAERRRLAGELRTLNESLELRVEQRTRELQRALDEIRDSEERYRRLMESAHDGIVVVRAEDGTIEAANPQIARLLGVPRDQVVGRSFLFPVPHASVPRHQDALAALLKVGRSEMHESELQRPDGTAVWVDGSMSTYEVRGVRYVLAILRDVTERRKAGEERRRLEERMQQAQKLESLGVLAGGVAHDFNNLLTGILGQAGLARDAAPTDGPLAEQLAQIELTARRAAELTRQLLAYSGRGQFVVRPLALGDLVRDTLALLRTSIPRAVTVELDAPDGLPAVEADATQLRQVVMNLVLNAAEAAGDRPTTIRVSTACRELDDAALAELRRDDDVHPGRYLQLEVADDGPGMTPEVQQRVFEPFFSTKFTGRGLGLAAVLGIVRGHRGAIGLRSAPGAGATFTVLLPASDRPAEFQPEPARPPSVPPPRTSAVPAGANGVVLVVDDEPAVRRFAAFVLARLGFDVVQATDGPQALDEYRRHADRVRLVLLDLTMPRMNGEQVLDELRRLRPDLPVVLSSGFDAQEVAARTTADQRTGFVQKPYPAESLETAVRRVLRNA